MAHGCRVPLQVTVYLAQVQQVRLLDIVGLCPGGIQDWCSVALGIDFIALETKRMISNYQMVIVDGIVNVPTFDMTKRSLHWLRGSSAL